MHEWCECSHRHNRYKSNVVKTRLQLQSRLLEDGRKAPGLVATAVTMVRREGVLSLWTGLPAAMTRGLLYGGLRLGLYSPFKQLVQDRQQGQPLSWAVKLVIGCTSGALAAAALSPTELVKTRLQQAGSQYQGVSGVVKDVVHNDGVRGLWKGAVPAMARASILTGAQCSTYEEVKQAVMRTTGWGDHAGSHLVSSMISGLVTTTVTNPVDVVKTHMFVGGRGYQGPLHCSGDLWRREGPTAFFKGWSANYARLGPQTVVTFLMVEQLRQYAGLASL